MIDYNHNKVGVNLKDQLLHMYMVGTKQKDELVNQTFQKVS
jgi:hypothetical protein